jgi:outer membrane protein assembly factor BamB
MARATAMAVSDIGETHVTGFPNLGPERGQTITAKFNTAGTQVWERSLGIQLAGSIAIALGANSQVFVESCCGPEGFAWYTTDYGQE